MSKSEKHEQEQAFEEQLKHTLGEAQQTVVDYVQKNPLKTIGFSLLAGVVLAKIFKERE